jgi:predicted ATPase
MKKTSTKNRVGRVIIQGYRRLYDVELELRPLMVLIGANGAGKTSFLEAWSLLAAAASKRLSRRLVELGGLDAIVTRDRDLSCRFHVWSDPSKQTGPHYQLRLETQGLTFEIAEEYFWSRPNVLLLKASHGDVEYAVGTGGKMARPKWLLLPKETALGQVPRALTPAEEFRQRLSSCVAYTPLDVSQRSAVRLPQQIHPTTLPTADGSDLIACLYTLKTNEPHRFEVLEDTLRAAFGDFQRLDFPNVAAGKFSLAWHEGTFARPFYLHELSEGTVRFLWLATLLLSPDLPEVTLIDEPEISLHPELFSLLVELMRDASARTQLMVATQSDRLVRFLKPEEVCAVDLNNGLARFTWGSDMDLEHWLAEYSLDVLWQKGRLGARS